MYDQSNHYRLLWTAYWLNTLILLVLSWERIQEIPPQWRWKNPLYLLSLISYHITLQRSDLSSHPLKSTAVLDTFMAGPVCIDDENRFRQMPLLLAKMVLNFFHMWQWGFPPSVGEVELSSQRTGPTDSKPCSCGPSVNRNMAKNWTTSCRLEDLLQQMNTEVLGWPLVRQ